MNRSLFVKLKQIILNPLFLFFIIIIVSLCTLGLNGLTAKDYYIDRQKAQTIIDKNWNGGYTKALETKLDALTNQKYYPINRAYNFLTFSVLAVFLIFIRKIKKYKDFLKVPAISNKIFVFSWINLSYILFCFLLMSTIESDLTIKVLPASADTLSIPLFSTIIFLFVLAFPYYILTNLLYFFTYRRTKNINVNLSEALHFYKPLLTLKYGYMTIFYLLTLAIISLLFIGDIIGKFYFVFPVQLMFYFTWGYLSLSAIAVLVSKFEQESTK